MRPAGALALLLWLPAAAAAGEVCAKVEAAGRPLPYGFVSLSPDLKAWGGGDRWGRDRPRPGPTRRSFVRLRGGEFCLKGVKRGNYVLSVSPLGFPEPMPLAYEGLAGSATAYRLTVEGGGARLRDAFGAAVSETGLPVLRAVEPPSGAEDALLEASLEFPEDASAEALAESFLVVVRLRSSERQGPAYYYYRWSDGPTSGGRRWLRLGVMPRLIEDIVVSSERLAIAAFEPPLVPLNTDPIPPRPGRLTRVGARLRPAGLLRGTVRLPDGRPFSPVAGVSEAEDRQVRVELGGLTELTRLCGAVDEDGRYECRPARSLWIVQASARWPARPSWGLDPPRMYWFDAGAERTIDLSFFEGARLRVGDGVTSLAPLWQSRYVDYHEFSRYVTFVPSGTFDPRKTCLLLSEDMLGIFAQGKSGWRQAGGTEYGGWAPVPPGTYDAYLLDTKRWTDLMATRVLARRPGVRLERGSSLDFSFAAEDYYPGGGGEVRGTMRFQARHGLELLKGMSKVSEFHQAVLPLVNVYDEAGRLAGVAMRNMTVRDHALTAKWMEEQDAASIASHFTREPGAFKLGGLPSGRYRAQIVAEGYETKELFLELGRDESRRLELDLDVMAGDARADAVETELERAEAELALWERPASCPEPGGGPELGRAAGDYAACRAVAAADAGVCAEAGSQETYCRHQHDTVVMSRALLGGGGDPEALCPRSLFITDLEGRLAPERRRQLCRAILGAGDADAACAGPPFDAPLPGLNFDRGVCARWMRIFWGRQEDCSADSRVDGDVADCLATRNYRRARDGAGAPACGQSGACRALLGEPAERACAREKKAWEGLREDLCRRRRPAGLAALAGRVQDLERRLAEGAAPGGELGSSRARRLSLLRERLLAAARLSVDLGR